MFGWKNVPTLIVPGEILCEKTRGMDGGAMTDGTTGHHGAMISGATLRLIFSRGFWPQEMDNTQFRTAHFPRTRTILVSWTLRKIASRPKGHVIYHAPESIFERFRFFLELISRFEFDFRRCGNYVCWTIRFFGVSKVQSLTMWPYMCLCCGLFVPTQFQFECCCVRDDSWWHIQIHFLRYMWTYMYMNMYMNM